MNCGLIQPDPFISPVEEPPSQSHKHTRNNMILNESTKWSAILWYQVLLMGGNWARKTTIKVPLYFKLKNSYLCYKPLLQQAHSVENVHSFHPHQSQHCSSCSWHSEASESSLQEEHEPEDTNRINWRIHEATVLATQFCLSTTLPTFAV